MTPASLGDWLTGALNAGTPLEGLSPEFGELVLRPRDPDGLIVKLVSVDLRDAPGFVPSAPGAGVPDHAALAPGPRIDGSS